MRTATEHIQHEVRELIRRRGLDPVADPKAARKLIDEVVDHYEERVGTSSLPPITQRPVVTREVFDAVAGFGPLQRFLDDEEVEEKDANRPLQAHPDGDKSPKTPKAVKAAEEKEEAKATGAQKKSATKRK